MHVGLFISSLLHAALLVWAFASMASVRPPEIKPMELIATDVISESELVKLRQGSRTAKLDDAAPKEVAKPDEAKKEPPKPKPVTAPPPPPLPPPAAAEPDPPPPPPAPPVKAAEPPPPPAPKAAEPEPDKIAMQAKLDELAMQEEQARLEAKARAEAKAKSDAEAKAKADAEEKARAEAEAKRKAEEKKKRELAEAKRKADEKRKAEEKRKADEAKAKQLDTARLSALLDKAPNAQPAPAAAPPPAAPTRNVGPVKGAAEGRDAVNQGASLIAAITNRIHTLGCWNIQAGGELASNQVPKIEFELNQDGTIKGEPRVLNGSSAPQFQLAVNAAKSALFKCQPFALPPDKYHLWRKVTLDFDPAEMFR